MPGAPRPREPLRVHGVPSGPRPRDGTSWREQIAAAAEGAPTAADGLDLRFTLRPRQFIDLDTLVQTATAGLRDAGVYRRGLPGLDAVLAVKRDGGGPPGVVISAVPAAALRTLDPPGPCRLDVAADALPGSARAGKARWREAIAAAWGGQPLLDAEAVWAEVAFGAAGSLLGPLEPVLDALEPVLGRDPRGRPWQEFFPGDDRIVWLRVARAPGARAVRLRLGQAAAAGTAGMFHTAS